MNSSDAFSITLAFPCYTEQPQPRDFFMPEEIAELDVVNGTVLSGLGGGWSSWYLNFLLCNQPPCALKRRQKKA
jgi:hypothetical protein